MAWTADQVKSAGTIIVTFLVVALVAIWTAVVLLNLGVKPEYDADGNVVIDQYTRAKDILTLVFPLATVAVGYWLGSEGKAKAEEKAKTAETEKAAAEQDAAAKVSAVRRAAAEADPAILMRAEELYEGRI